MAMKVLSSTPVIVMWLEPKRDRGKESTVKAKEIVKPHRNKLQPGLTALIKWKSSGRIYKAIIKSMQGLQADDTVPNAENADIDVEQPSVATGDSRLAAVCAVPDIISENQTELFHEIRRDTRDLKTEVGSMTNEIGEMKTEFLQIKNEIRQMKTELSQMLFNYNANLQLQLGSVLEAIKQLNGQTGLLTNLVTNMINHKISITPSRTELLAGTAGVTSTPRRDTRDLTPLYGVLDGDNVKIEVDAETSIFVRKTTYENYFSSSLSPTSFLRKLMCHFFTEEEMLTGNFEGGEVVTSKGRVHMKQLDPNKRKALLRQVELEFNGSTKTYEEYAKLKSAINDRCRSERRKYK